MKSKNVSKQDSAYPSRLLSLAQPPQQLFVRGAAIDEMLRRPLVAVVGSRKVSQYGRQVTEQLVRELVRAGVVIISGLALGVDSIAHKAALDAGGTTIAVLPCGIDTIYPASHFGLAKQILQHDGALVSEYDGRDAPQKYQFIARNRIIAGLSDGVLITEAAAKSGSLHTADFALELGIEVFAVPGNITSPNSEGTNSLIKIGAAVVTKAQDIFEALSIKPTSTSVQLPARQALVYQAVTQEQTSLASLLAHTQLNLSTLQQELTALGLQGLVTLRPDGHWQKA